MNRSLCRLIVSAHKWTSILPRRNVAHFTFVKDQPDPSLGENLDFSSLIDDSLTFFLFIFRSNERNESLSNDSKCSWHNTRQRSHSEFVETVFFSLKKTSRWISLFFSRFRRRCRVRRRFSMHRRIETKIRCRSSFQHALVRTRNHWFWYRCCCRRYNSNRWNSICWLHFSRLRSSQNVFFSDFSSFFLKKIFTVLDRQRSGKISLSFTKSIQLR